MKRKRKARIACQRQGGKKRLAMFFVRSWPAHPSSGCVFVDVDVVGDTVRSRHRQNQMRRV